MPITDNRTQLTDAEAIAPGGFPGEFVDEAGGSMTLNLDTDTFIEGVSSIADQGSSSRIGILWQEDANRDWSGNVFYIWWNCVVANKLGTKQNGGVTIRFTGATITDWFEIYIDGSDTYGGGFKMSVIDIDEARAIAVGSPNAGLGATNGTPPATTAIRRVGVMWDVLTGAPGSADNCFLDSIWRLPVGEPGVIVSGENTAVSPIQPYDWADVLAAGDNTDPTKAWGVIRERSGVIFLNTPVQFGSNGSPDDGDHDFEDTNVVISWESQVVADNFYGFSVVGDPTNTQRFIAGVKNGTGDEATGSQGWTVLAASDGPRWFIDCFDAEIDDAQWQGCTFIHTTAIDIDNVNTEMRSTQLIDGQRLWHSRSASPRSGAAFQRNSIITADPVTFDESPIIGSPANVAYIWTADPDKMKFNTFNYFTGHAINITEGGTFEFEGNVFDALWNAANSPNGDGSLEAALYQNTQFIIEINITDGDTPTTAQLAIDAEVIASDDFNRASVGGDWLNGPGVFEEVILQDGEVAAGPTGTAECLISRSAEVWPQDQYCEAVVRNPFIGYGGVNEPGVGVRFSGNSPNDEGVYMFPERLTSTSPFTGRLILNHYPGGTTFLGGGDANWTLTTGVIKEGDVIRLAVVGDTYYGYLNGELIGTHTEVFGAVGAPALLPTGQSFNSPNGLRNRFDDWEGGYAGSLFIINNNVSVTLIDIEPGTEIRVYPSESPINTTEIAGIENTGSPSEFTFSAAAGLVVEIVIHHVDFIHQRIQFEIPTESAIFPISQLPERVYNNPV